MQASELFTSFARSTSSATSTTRMRIRWKRLSPSRVCPPEIIKTNGSRPLICMRLIGMAQRSLELMARRSSERVAFGRTLRDFSSIRQEIAISRCEIEQARLLTLSAADKMDKFGNKVAKDLIAMIKVVAPNMALKVIDRAMQIHGGKGLSSDTPLAHYFAMARILRLADGPDEVHLYQLGKSTIAKYFQG